MSRDEVDGGVRTGQNHCSVVLHTKDRPETDATPIEQYQSKGYVSGDSPDSKALDAAVALTASSWGPPMSSSPDEVDKEWFVRAYLFASRAVENAIVEGVLDT